jgi:hypothetical protein
VGCEELPSSPEEGKAAELPISIIGDGLPQSLIPVEEDHASDDCLTHQIGVPVDGIWDFVDAYEHRMCYNHGQIEWLLRANDTWMLQKDFGVLGACKRLSERLNHGLNPHRDRALLSRNHAECDSTLWSQIEAVTDVRLVDGVTSYRIRWKLQWVPESSVDDLEWVHRSFASKTEELGRRRSSRLDRIPRGLTAKQEAMPRVINIA